MNGRRPAFALLALCALLCVLLLPRGAAAAGPAQEHGLEDPATPQGPGGTGLAQGTVEKASDPASAFTYLYNHVLPHKVHEFEGGTIPPIYNINVWQAIAVGVMFVVFILVRISLAMGKMNPFTRLFSGFVLWVRDEMVAPVMGHHHGDKLLPYFLFVFFFIAFMNLLGLLPFGATPTASIWVTGALALTTFVLMIGGGMVVQGPVAFWKHLIPPGIPVFLIPIMAIVEIIGLLVRPFALTIRLFANMLAGHLVILSFMGLIFFFAASLGKGAYAVAIPSVGLAAFVMIIESFVSLLQAYIFTYLSIIFVAACMHPEH